MSLEHKNEHAHLSVHFNRQCLNMQRTQRFVILGLAAAVGFATPWVVPQGALAYFLGASLLLVIVSATLAGASARGGHATSRGLRAIAWLVAGTSRPTAQVGDQQALFLFWLALAYLASFGVGAFAAIRL